MSGINSSFQVNRYLEKHNIKIASDEINKELGEIFEADKLTNNFPFASYSKGAHEFLQLLDKRSKVLSTIEDGSIDSEDIAVLELEKDFANVIKSCNLEIVLSLNGYDKTLSFIQKYQDKGLNRIKLFIDENKLHFIQEYNLKDNLERIVRKEESLLQNIIDGINNIIN